MKKLQKLVDNINQINGTKESELDSYILDKYKSINNKVYYSIKKIVTDDGGTVSICQGLKYAELKYLLIGILYGFRFNNED
jgi:hypothetical protein